MRDDSTENVAQPDGAADEQERIRKQRITELLATCDRIGAEAQARGLTEEILNEILNEELNAEEKAASEARLHEFRAIVAEKLSK